MTAGCEVYGTVVNSVLGEAVTVGKGAVVKDSVIMRGTVIGEGAVVKFGMIDENCTVENNCVIGDDTSDKNHIALIGRGRTLAPGTVVKPGEIID